MVDARVYHERTKHHPGELGGSGEAMNPALKPRPWKQYRSVERISLPGIRRIAQPTLSLIAERAAEPRVDPTNGESRFDRQDIASLCHAAAGITQSVTTDTGETIRFRAASCTGKLYHNDLYIACGQGSDLDAGLYHFDPHGMALNVLREGDVRGVLADAVGTGDGTGDAVANAPIIVIATSHWWRNAWKYTERTYRHAFWDSGTIIANLLAAAHADDRRASVVTAFADEQVAELVGVDPAIEAPVALIPIGGGDSVTGDTSIDPIDPAVVPVSSDTIEYPLIADAWEQSTLTSGAAAVEWRQSVREFVANRTAVSVDEGIAVDPVDHETASVRPFDATFRRRGSCRDYADTGPSRRKIGTVLDRALRGVPGDWNGDEAEGPSVIEPYVIVAGSPGIDDGSYRYDPERARLEPLGICDATTMERLALGQSWAGDAHVNVYLMADIDSLVEELGNRAYRLAQLEAGITLGRLYLATYAHRELGGTGLTFFDDLVTDHFSPAARSMTPMCLFAFGRAAE